MNKKTAIPLSFIGLGVIILLALQFGGSSIHILSLSESAKNILLHIRIPRVLLGLSTGLVLATSGGVLQGMLHNPLAEPYLLGISSGAALGSIVGLLLKKVYFMPLFGFFGALLSMILVWKIAQKQKFIDKTRLILSGIIVTMFFSAIIALLMSIFRRDLSQIFSIIMGNLGYMFSCKTIYLLWLIVFLSLAGTIVLNVYALRLNVLSLGDYSATSLGVNVYKTRKVLFILTSFLVGIIVSFVGIIGFVGLIIPHISRMLVGPNNKLVLPLAGILGAGFLILCDTIARSILVIELPVGVITALFGAPFFVFLLKRK
ncbi:MAG TPA: iron ABC transporter permease [Candidatus Cloacimonetes bacterium]|nr:iron ABC transporter permease [Candidatus Cloacimonadota bacterium]HEX37699.1 iron ABC transporter permease [Candidatus Cloacimonadota bacterium]